MGQRLQGKTAIISGQFEPLPITIPGVQVREFVSGACGARGLSTGTTTFLPRAELAYHTHTFSEAITILAGQAEVTVQDRRYLLSRFDCIHIPAHTVHRVTNPRDQGELVALWAFAFATPSREFVKETFREVDRGDGLALPGDPEYVVRFSQAEIYEISAGAHCRDLFAGRFGAAGICGGTVHLQPGASLPCRQLRYDKSITIVDGEAVCLVQSRQYVMSECDTVFIPQEMPHRFLNRSERPMALVWVCAGYSPEGTVIDDDCCNGSLDRPENGSRA